MGGICSSEESQFRRADGAFRYLQHSFFSGLLQKSFMVEMGLRKQSPLLSGAVPTIQSPGATKSAGKVLKGASDLQCLQHKMAAQLGHVLPR